MLMRKEKGLSISNLALLLVIFKAHHCSERVKIGIKNKQKRLCIQVKLVCGLGVPGGFSLKAVVPSFFFFSFQHLWLKKKKKVKKKRL